MSTIRILLGILCLAAFGRSAEPGSSFLTRNTLVEIARSQIGVCEATGNNDGVQVESFLKVFKQAGFTKPRTAWSPGLFSTARLTLFPKPADVLGIYSIKLKRIAHRQNNWIISIEGG